LLNVDKNAKTIKGRKKNFVTGILYLAPARESGYQTCSSSSPGCRISCLYGSGRSLMFPAIKEARIRKTKMFFEQRKEFMLMLEKDIEKLISYGKKNNFNVVCRLNGTSNIFWERISFESSDGKNYNNIMERFPNVQFYDYTKHSTHKNLPKNYHITFSLSENNEHHARKAIENNMNIAVVFRNKNLPKEYLGLRVISGDEDDIRPLDPKGVCVGLYAKGAAKADRSGFVKDI
jgi:hypothetical protein